MTSPHTATAPRRSPVSDVARERPQDRVRSGTCQGNQLSLKELTHIVSRPDGLDQVVTRRRRGVHFSVFRTRSGLRALDVEFGEGKLLVLFHPYATPIGDPELPEITAVCGLYANLSDCESGIFKQLLDGRTLDQIAAAEQLAVAEIEEMLSSSPNAMVTRNHWVQLWVDVRRVMQREVKAVVVPAGK